MLISHASPSSPTRKDENHRYKVTGDGTARLVRQSYRMMRRDGVSKFWARHYTVTFLRTGMYHTSLVDAKRTVSA
jgi:hypothetical protein